MYLHLGQETVVPQDEILGIFDLETTTVSKVTRTYLAGCEKRGEVVNVTDDLPKSFIVCTGGSHGTQRVYISQISTATLAKRAGAIDRLIGRARKSDRG